MSPESGQPRLGDLVTDLKTRLDDLEAQLDDELEGGRERIDALTADLRERLDELRGEVPEPEPSRADQLLTEMESLRDAVEAEVEETTERLSVILSDVERQVRKLEQRVRDR